MNVVSYPMQLNSRIEVITLDLSSLTLSDADAGKQLAKLLQDVNMTILSDEDQFMLAGKFNKAMDLFAKRCVGFSGFCAFAEICRNPNGGMYLVKRITVFG